MSGSDLAPSVDYDIDEVEHKGIEEIKFTKEPSDGYEDGFDSDASKSNNKRDTAPVNLKKDSSRIKDLNSNDDSDSSDPEKEFEEQIRKNKEMLKNMKDDLEDSSGKYLSQ